MSYSVIDIKKSMPEAKKKTDKLDLWVSIFARPLSYYITWILLKFGVSASGTSILALIIGSVGSLLLLTGSFYVGFIGVLLINLWIVIDCADGNVARVTQTTSKFGELLDAISGYIFVCVLYTCLGLAAYLYEGILPIPTNYKWIFILAGAIASLSSILPRLIEHKAINLIPNYHSNITKKGSYNLLYVIAFNIGAMSGLMLPLMLIAYIFNSLDIYILFYSIFHFAVAGVAILKTIKKARL